MGRRGASGGGRVYAPVGVRALSFSGRAVPLEGFIRRLAPGGAGDWTGFSLSPGREERDQGSFHSSKRCSEECIYGMSLSYFSRGRIRFFQLKVSRRPLCPVNRHFPCHPSPHMPHKGPETKRGNQNSFGGFKNSSITLKINILYISAANRSKIGYID